VSDYKNVPNQNKYLFYLQTTKKELIVESDGEEMSPPTSPENSDSET